jgi:hypothetical protein
MWDCRVNVFAREKPARNGGQCLSRLIYFVHEARMTAKQQAQDVLQALPDDCSMEQIQYHLYVADKIRQRLDTADDQPPIPHEEVKKRLEKWLIK